MFNILNETNKKEIKYFFTYFCTLKTKHIWITFNCALISGYLLVLVEDVSTLHEALIYLMSKSDKMSKSCWNTQSVTTVQAAQLFNLFILIKCIFSSSIITFILVLLSSQTCRYFQKFYNNSRNSSQNTNIEIQTIFVFHIKLWRLDIRTKKEQNKEI